MSEEEEEKTADNWNWAKKQLRKRSWSENGRGSLATDSLVFFSCVYHALKYTLSLSLFPLPLFFYSLW